MKMKHAMIVGSLLMSASTWAASVNMLSCCPGENTANEARFVWHSDSDACLLFCAKRSDPANVHTILPRTRTKKPVTFRASDVTYYKYEADISDLDPGTEYLYWVEVGGESTARQRFKTAGKKGSYNFLWMSDVHAGVEAKTQFAMNTLELMRQDAETQTAASGGIDFVLFSGDAVRYGSRYDNWQKWNGAPTITNYTFAAIPGNKEYYYTGSSTFYHYNWYLAVKNNPPNGPDATEQEGCYWFLRDSVMFVGIDSLIHKGEQMDMYGKKSAVLTAQTNWFDNVVTSQQGNFRYLVVFQHDPWFVYDDGSADKSRGNYDTWRHVFDKHKVDLALSGDEHNYVRSRPLRGDAENSDGTVYMVSGEIASTNYSATISTGISKYFACVGTSGATCGASWIEVRPESLKLTHYWDKWQSPNYKVYDTVTITPKDRGWSLPIGFDSPSPHSRYRFAVDAPRSDSWCMQLSEIELLDANGAVIPSSQFTIAYDSTTKPADGGDPYPSNESPPNAVDGSLNTKWLDWRAGLSESAATRSAVWLDFRFTSPVTLSGYRWYTANDANSRTPVSWTFSCSDDDGATWTVIDKVAGYNTTTEFKTLAYEAPEDDDGTEDPIVPEEPVTTTAGGTYYALSEGVNNYKNNRQGQLSGCVPDAKNVLSACTNAVRGLWLPENCYGLYDSEVTKSAVRGKLQSLAGQAQSGDTVLYYHSSHGGEDCICLYDKEYYADELAEDLMLFKTGVRVVIVLDTCHSGSMFKGADDEATSSMPWDFAASVQAHMEALQATAVQTKGVKAAAGGPSVGWVTACDDDQTSLDIGTGGWFTTPFVEAWKSTSTDANGDGFNDFKEAFNIAAPQAIDSQRAPQTMNESVLRSVAAWRTRIDTSAHGMWVGGSGGNKLSVAANWGDGQVPGAGETINFSAVASATTVNADLNVTFGSAVMGSEVVTFTGSLTANSFSDTSKVAVGANATVTVAGDLVFANATENATDYIANSIAAGGAFVVTGDIISSPAGRGYVVPTVNGGDGTIVAKGLVQNSSCSDNPSFRLVRDAAGTVRWVIGADGISGTKNYWLLNNAGGPVAIIKADSSDFTVSAKIGNRQAATLRFDTTGRDGVGHTITLTGCIYREGKVYVEGSGTVACAYSQSDSSDPFTVSDTATLSLAGGSNIGTGGVTVNSGSALALSGSGTATMGGTLTLNADSRFVVGATEAGAARPPYLAVKSVSIADGAIVAADSTFPVGSSATVLTISGTQTLTDADLAKFSSSDGCILSLADNGKSIVATRYGGTWTGGMTLSVPTNGVSIGAAAFDVSNASRENPITVSIGGGGTLAADSTNMVLSATSLPEANPAEYLTLANAVPPGYAALFYTEDTSIYVSVIPVKWIDESAEKAGLTGAWSGEVSYEDGKAYLEGENVFTPNTVSTGDVVTVELTTLLYESDEDGGFDGESAQAAVRLSTNGCFQVWTGGSRSRSSAPGWIDVAAEGVTPVSGADYTLRFALDYTAGTYSAYVGGSRLVATASDALDCVPPGTANFSLAVSTNCVTSVAFMGETLFTSLVGENIVAVGFADKEEVVLENASIILDEAKAAWLNRCTGGKAALAASAAGISSNDFVDAYLLNLDIGVEDAGYTFEVTGIEVLDDQVRVAVTLTRTGAVMGDDGETPAPIKGVLKFYGAKSVSAFKDDDAEPIDSKTFFVDDFSEGDTVTATFDRDGTNTFFNAKIEEPEPVRP